MGYYTRYSIQAFRFNLLLEEENVFKEVTQVLSKEQRERFIGYAVAEDGSTCDNVKWYDHSKDMKEFSKAIPDVLFIVEGHGEEADDLWKKYYLNGKEQVAVARMTYDPFDFTKLK